MASEYWIYSDELKGKSNAIGTGKPVTMEIMNQKDKIWNMAEIMIFEGEMEGAEPVGLLGPYGEPHDEGKYYVKILKILPSPLDDDE